MTSRATWRSLAITYGVVAVMPLHLAVTMLLRDHVAGGGTNRGS
ncbi:hypothetical protein [Amycolatopsis sp. FBCC-B4732]|nr:hypothetical protein [Amycolatopsis sp. FBCC-B4732]